MTKSHPYCAVLRRLAPSCAVLPSAPSCEMVGDGANGERSETTAIRPQCVTSQKHSLSLLVSPVRTSRQRQTRRPRLLFCSAKCSHQRQQQQEEASSSSRRKQQKGEAAVAGGSSSSSRQAAAAAGKQQASRQAAAGKQAGKQAGKLQQQARSREEAAGKQQPAFAPLKE